MYNYIALNIFTYIQHICSQISQYFTNTESATILLTLIFLISCLIIVVLLLKLLVSQVKKLFRAIFSRSSQKNTSAVDISKTEEARPFVSTDSEESSQESYFSILESFNDQYFSEQLTTKYERMIDVKKSTDVLEHLQIEDETQVLPTTDSDIDNENNNKINEEMYVIREQVENMSIDELNQLLIAENEKEHELAEEINAANSSLTIYQEQRKQLITEESSALDKYNAKVDEYNAQNHNFNIHLSHISNEYSDLLKYIESVSEQSNEMLAKLESLYDDIYDVPEKIQDFINAGTTKIREISTGLRNIEDALNTSKSLLMQHQTARSEVDNKIITTQNALNLLKIANIIHTETVVLLKFKIEEQKKIEEARLAEEARRIAEKKENEKIKEELKKLLPEGTIDLSSWDASEIKAYVRKNAQNAYVMDYDNISPETYAKLFVAQYKKSRSNQPPKDESTVSASTQSPTAADISVPIVSTSDDSDAAEDVTPADNPNPVDYMAELRKEWAAARAHKEEWEAEKERRRAEEQQRKEELNSKKN